MLVKINFSVSYMFEHRTVGIYMQFELVSECSCREVMVRSNDAELSPKGFVLRMLSGFFSTSS
jgi:hypothetical protein